VSLIKRHRSLSEAVLITFGLAKSPKDTVELRQNKTNEMDIQSKVNHIFRISMLLLHVSALLENTERRSFRKNFEIKKYIKRYVKMPCKQVSLSKGAHWGN
jgi:hypothetical protein